MASREDLDPYRVLGVPRQASPDEIARAYRRAARLTHPDGTGSGAGSERFRAVSDAYEVLRDPGRRAGYDRRHPPAPSEEGRTARYAGPGSQHIVLGSPRAARNVPSLGGVEELLTAIRSLLRGGW